MAFIAIFVARFFTGMYCRLRCWEMKDKHHIFSDCPHFDNWRQEAGQQLKNTLAARLNQSNLDNKTVLLNKAKFFYNHNINVWLFSDSQMLSKICAKNHQEKAIMTVDC